MGNGPRISQLSKGTGQNCNFAYYEKTVIRDVFITIISDTETQQQLLRETEDPNTVLTVLQTAIYMEKGQQNQLNISRAAQFNINTVQINSCFRRTNQPNQCNQ